MCISHICGVHRLNLCPTFVQCPRNKAVSDKAVLPDMWRVLHERAKHFPPGRMHSPGTFPVYHPARTRRAHGKFSLLVDHVRGGRVPGGREAAWPRSHAEWMETATVQLWRRCYRRRDQGRRCRMSGAVCARGAVEHTLGVDSPKSWLVSEDQLSFSIFLFLHFLPPICSPIRFGGDLYI